MDTPDFYWITKRTVVGAPQWTQEVKIAKLCPDQREYRRMTRRERIQYQNAIRK